MIQAQVLDYESAHLKLKSYYDYESVVQVQAQVLLLNMPIMIQAQVFYE